jgi:DNA-binding beta-propeller fold protein YncE
VLGAAPPEFARKCDVSRKGKIMSLRNLLFFSIVAAFGLGRPVFSQVNGIDVGNGATAQIFGGQSPVVKVLDVEGKEVSSIPIEQDPDIFPDLDSPLLKGVYIGVFAYSKSNNTLYIVHKEKKGEHFISAVNLTTSRVDKKIVVNAGQQVGIYLSSDGRRLFSYAGCKPAFSCFGAEKYGPPYEPAITVIDTASNEVIATYDLYDGFRGDVLSKRNAYFVNRFLAYSDEEGLIVQAEVRRLWNGKDESISDRIVGFSGNSPKPNFTIDAGAPLGATMFSKDHKLLFATFEGNKKTQGSLLIFDLENKTSVQHPLTDHPTTLLRLGKNQEPWLLGDEKMRAFSETGEITDERIALNKPRKSEDGSESGASVFLNGFPEETISLGDDRAAILIGNKNGLSKHKLALIDLKKLQVDAIIPTLSASEVTRIRTGNFLLSVVLTAATLGNVIFTPSMTISNEALAALPNGRFLFTLDRDGHEVAIIDALTATVLKRIPVNGSVYKLQISADGKHLICSGKNAQMINLETNNLED